jgi:hypothetical protein
VYLLMERESGPVVLPRLQKFSSKFVVCVIVIAMSLMCKPLAEHICTYILDQAVVGTPITHPRSNVGFPAVGT